jgi:hypothetical protein
MRTGITFDVTATDRIRLEAIVAKRGSPQKHFGKPEKQFL